MGKGKGGKGGNGGKKKEANGRNAVYRPKNGDEIAAMIFVYTFHYIFMNMKAEELHRDFKDTSGRRLKRVGLFTGDLGDGVLGMSRNRYGRIIGARDFRISKGERERWERKFKIDLDFFKPDRGKGVLGKDISVWETYTGGGAVEGIQGVSWVNDELGKVLREINSYIGTPYYSIYFYLRNKKAYEPRSSVQAAVDYLKMAGLKEWKGVPEEEKEKSLEVLEKHYRYLRMKLEIGKMEKEE